LLIKTPFIIDALRRCCGLKKQVRRDIASREFYRHAGEEGQKLAVCVADALNDWSCGALGPYSENRWSEIFDRRVGPFTSGKVTEMHCHAIALAAGLSALRDNIDPPSQNDVVAWDVHRMIVASDVGEGNIGRAKSPWPAPDMHVSWAPGSFEGGMRSEQQRRVRFYQSSRTTEEKLVVLLISLGALSPEKGIEKPLFRRERLAADLVRFIQVGSEVPEQPITDWDEEFVITDPAAALGAFPREVQVRLTTAIEQIDPFWPSFTASHRLVW
jgi:hypothetical protein